MSIFQGLTHKEISLLILGYASVLTHMIDEGADPLYDGDVRDYLRRLESDVSEELLDQSVSEFYEIYDAVLDASR